MTHTVSPQGKEEKKAARPPAKKKTFIVIIRPEFKAICQDDACRAGMFNHILYNVARAKQQGSEYWHSTGDDIWEETQRSWGKSKTLKEIKDLVTTGIVAQTSNPKNSWDRTKYYTFGEAEAKKLHELCVKNKVCLASIKFPVAVSHLLNLTNAFCKNNKCICCNQQIDLLNLTDRFVDFNIPTDLEAACGDAPEVPKDSTQDSTQDSFLHADENASYSQPCEPAHGEKKEEVVDGSDRSWLQETAIQPEQASPAPSEVVTQASLVPEPAKPAKPKSYNIPARMSMKPEEPTFTRTPTAKELEKQYQRREQEIWSLLDRLFGVQVARGGYNKAPVERMARNESFTDEHITTTFKAIDQDKYTKLTVANIENEMPTRVRDQTKPKETAPQEQPKPINYTQKRLEAERRRKEIEEDNKRYEAEKALAALGG